MADLIMWSGGGGISFYTKSGEIRGVKDFGINVSAETEDNTQNSEKFVKKKNSGSYQISMTAVLNAALGVDVQALALKMTEAARCGSTGYFYTAGAKLFPSKFMCTDAKINNIQLTGKGTWSACEVQWTLKQCSKFDGTTSSSTTSSSSTTKTPSSSKKTTTTSTKTTLAGVAGAVAGAVKGAVSTVKSVVSSVVSTVSAAKKASTAAKTNLTTKKTTSKISSLIKKVAKK